MIQKYFKFLQKSLRLIKEKHHYNIILNAKHKHFQVDIL